MKVLGNRALVKRIDFEKENKSGIVLPQQVRAHTFIGEVITTGKGLFDKDGNRIPMEVKAGDKVLFSSTIGWHLENEDGNFTIINEMDVLLILREDSVGLINGRLLVEEVKKPLVTASGLILPSTRTNETETRKAVVLAKAEHTVTEEGVLIPTQIEVGEKIMISERCGYNFKKDGKDLIVVNERDVIGIIEEDK